MSFHRVFLSGGTGTLGLEVLPRLLGDRSVASVTLLLRAEAGQPVDTRLDSIRRYLRYWWPQLDTSRLTALAGDVTQRHLGLAPADHRRLSRETTHVLHSAASTRLGMARSCARKVNVTGTRNMVAFARNCSALVHFGHVSTAYVCGRREGLILERIEAERPVFNNEYERSKLEAENLVRKKMRGRPYSIFRPSIIVGDSHDGHVSSFATLYYPLRLMASGELRWLPCEPDARLDLVTVDFVASAVSRLLVEAAGEGRVFHVTAGEAGAVRIDDLAQAAIEMAGVDRLRPMRFSPNLEVQSEAASRVRIFFDYLHGTRCFDTRNLQGALGPQASRHAPARSFLPAAFGFCRQTEWGTHLPWESEPSWRSVAL